MYPETLKIRLFQNLVNHSVKRQDSILWTQNDHGDDPRVIALSNEGQRISIVTLEGIENEDWEDIATTVIDGTSYLLVADTGRVNQN